MEISEVVNEVGNILKSIGAERVMVRKEGRCYLLVSKFRNDAVLISIRSGEFFNGFIVKVVPTDKVANIPWECRYLEYVPYGLYLLVSNVSDLRSRLPDKVKRVLSVLITR